jgi:hypothetical protein
VRQFLEDCEFRKSKSKAAGEGARPTLDRYARQRFFTLHFWPLLGEDVSSSLILHFHIPIAVET